MRRNGWYYHNMVCYCLENNIITLENIKFVVRSPLSINKYYYNIFIDYCYKNIENNNKSAINSMTGNFKPNVHKHKIEYNKQLLQNSRCQNHGEKMYI